MQSNYKKEKLLEIQEIVENNWRRDFKKEEEEERIPYRWVL